MPVEDRPGEQRVRADVSTLKGQPQGTETMVYTVTLKGPVGDLWIDGYRRTTSESDEFRRFELDAARSTIRFACRTADGPEIVFEMLERLEALVARVNQLTEIWRSQVPRVRVPPASLRPQ